MDIAAIIGMIDEDKIKLLGQLYAIDKVNNKITGEFILKVFIKGALSGYPISLRSIETLCNKDKALSSLLKSKDAAKKKIDHASIGKRLKKMNSRYFQAVYEDTVIKYNEQFGIKECFHRFDSTTISLSGKLLKGGLDLGGKEGDRQIKMSVGLKNFIPTHIRFCGTQSEASEDIALVGAVNEARITKKIFCYLIEVYPRERH